VWIREAAFPESSNTNRPTPEWTMEHEFDGHAPDAVMASNPILKCQEQFVRDQEFDPALFTPADQMRQWARMPAEFPMNPANTLLAPGFGDPQPEQAAAVPRTGPDGRPSVAAVAGHPETGPAAGPEEG
jgi:hypothetical protein